MSMHIEDIKTWFERAVPNPTWENKAAQISCHYEESGEFADAIVNPMTGKALHEMAEGWRNTGAKFDEEDRINRKELLDALCDQIVTAVGVAHMFGMDIAGALSEVNRSNWSKFVDGQPVFNEHGKIAKGPQYEPPNLELFL